MKRTNTFAVRPLSAKDEQLLRDLLDASAALWNETNYERLIRYDNEDGLKDENVWDAPTGRLEGQYKGVLGASTAQQVIRKNSEAWRAFFRLKDRYYDESNSSVTEHPEPPGFRGNKDDGRELKTVIRNTSYSIEWGDRSRLEILVGSECKTDTTTPAASRSRSLASRTGPTTTNKAASTCGTTMLTAPSELRSP